MENISWKRKDPTKVTNVGRRTVVSKTFEMPDGAVQTFDTKDAENASAVAVIALTANNKVLIVDQFRPGPEKIMQELPGGGVEEGEDILAAGMRELREETGYTSSEEPEYLGCSYYDAYTNGGRHAMLIRNCVPSGEGQALEDTEFGTVSEIDAAQLIMNAMQGQLTDPGAVLMAYPQLQEIARNG